MEFLRKADPELFSFLQKETERQQFGLEMIASENYTSLAVMEAQGSILTNKYAEGYPGKRYYGGCEFVDEIETLAIERAKKLFNCQYANVQPHAVPRRIWPFTLRQCRRETRFWEWIFPMVGI